MSRAVPEMVCADCNSTDPSWASINRGVFLCDECCSVHRKLGRHISQIKSIKKGQWHPTQLAMVRELVRLGANNIWEHSLLDPSLNKKGRKKPTKADPLYNTKYEFIMSKYKNLAFMKGVKDEDSSTLDDLNQQLFATVRSGELTTSFRFLCLGADANYWNQKRGMTSLHVAAEHGQTLQCELLVVYGADPAVPDNRGRTPAHLAASNSHSDLAARLIECQFELTDRLTQHLCERKPDHRAGQHFVIPAVADNLNDMSQLERKARSKLQALRNNLLEELAMDVFDEVDRRENDAIWVSMTNSPFTTDRTAVPHLPVNPDLSQTRNQGRQKLGRLSAREFATLIIDLLTEIRKRQTGLSSPSQTSPESRLTRSPQQQQQVGVTPSQLVTSLHEAAGAGGRTSSTYSDREPVYDDPPDEDYQSLDNLHLRQARHEQGGEGDASQGVTSNRAGATNRHSARDNDEAHRLRRALQASESRVAEMSKTEQHMVQEIHNLKTRVSVLEAENSVLKDGNGLLMSGQRSSVGRGPVGDPRAPPRPDGARRMMVVADRHRPVSMIEASEMRHLAVRLEGGKQASSTSSGASRVPPLPSASQASKLSPQQQRASDPEETRLARRGSTGSEYDNDTEKGTEGGGRVSRAEAVAKNVREAIQALMSAAQQGRRDSLTGCAEKVQEAVDDVAAFFPKPITEERVSSAVSNLRSSSERLLEQCRALSGTGKVGQDDVEPGNSPRTSRKAPRPFSQHVQSYAYDLVKAAKEVVLIIGDGKQ